MVRLLSAWAAATVIWLVGFAVVAHFTPTGAPGEPPAGMDQVMRLHLPWVVIATLMSFAAGVVHRDTTQPVRRMLAVLVVPAVATLAGVVGGIAGQSSAATVLLYVAEGAMGVMAGLVLAKLTSVKKAPSGYW
ncbi:MAG: hypothetical protein J2P17_07310 [Mycobacterium sp.]|nr:hypothetical protein [Mycobacterium sp.]